MNTHMKTQTMEFATITKKGVVTQIGRSTVLCPKTEYKPRETKWFDDSQLIKKEYRK